MRDAARFESDSAFVAHHENLEVNYIRFLHSHQGLSDVHPDDCDVNGEVSGADWTSESYDHVADGTDTLPGGDVPATNGVTIREVGAYDGHHICDDVRWRR